VLFVVVTQKTKNHTKENGFVRVAYKKKEWVMTKMMRGGTQKGNCSVCGCGLAKDEVGMCFGCEQEYQNLLMDKINEATDGEEWEKFPDDEGAVLLEDD